MSRYARFLAMTVLALTAATAIVTAQTPPPGPRQRARQFMAGLNLTDAQREQIRTLREQHRSAVGEERQQLRDARRELRSQMLVDTPDQARIDALQEQVASLSQQLQARRLDLQQKIAQVLTPEQRQFLREHRGRMRPFRGRGMRGGRI